MRRRIVAHGDADRCDERHDEYIDGIHGDADVFQDGHDKAHDQDEHIRAEAFKERRQVGGEQSRESCRGQKAADGAREKDDEENLHGDIIEHFIDGTVPTTGSRVMIAQTRGTAVECPPRKSHTTMKMVSRAQRISQP